MISSVEFGYRGLRVEGDLNKYQSDLNYKAGPRVFDSSFLLKSTDGKEGLFESLLATSTGWGADPQGNLRVSVEKPEWYHAGGNEFILLSQLESRANDFRVSADGKLGHF